MIGIIDYGMGNLRSVEKAFAYLGCEAKLVDNPADIVKADKIVLPGVGAFCDAIATIRKKEFDKAIKEVILEGKYFLGICLGMQLLFERSFENGEYEGLSILNGDIVYLNVDEKIPHMGWNSLDIKKENHLLQEQPEQPYVYFVHSYHLVTTDDIVTATTFYGKEIQVAVEKNNIFGFQFHPEKSGDMGLQMLKNFGGL